MIVLFDVRCRATNISSPIATRESLTISTVKGSMSVRGAIAISGFHLDDEVSVLVHVERLPGEDHRGRGGLLHDRGPLERGARPKPPALVDAALAPPELVEVDVPHALEGLARVAVRIDPPQLGLAHGSEPGDPKVDELDRRVLAECVQLLVEGVETALDLLPLGLVELPTGDRHVDGVFLAGVAHVRRAGEGDLLRRDALVGEELEQSLLEPVPEAGELSELGLVRTGE